MIMRILHIVEWVKVKGDRGGNVEAAHSAILDRLVKLVNGVTDGRRMCGP